MILTKMTLENSSDVPQICSGTLRIIKMILTKMTLENSSDVPQICSGTLRIIKMILTKMTLENSSDVPQICSGTLRIAPRALNFQHFLGEAPKPPHTERGPLAPPPSVPSP